jgi:hypothetical protein
MHLRVFFLFSRSIPFSPPSDPAQRLFQEPPAESKFLPADSNTNKRNWAPEVISSRSHTTGRDREGRLHQTRVKPPAVDAW